MKNKKWWIKFKNGKLRLIILIVVSLTAGLHLLIDPKSVNELVIRGVGFVWIMEAISYCLDLRLNKLKKQKEALSIQLVSNQRELLLAFAEHLFEGHDKEVEARIVDDYLNSK